MRLGVFAWPLSLSAAMAVMEDDEQTDDRAEGHERIGRDKHPVSHEKAISGEPARRGDLADEKPLGNARAGALFPLLVNLLRDCQKQDQRTCPTQ